MTWVQGRDDAGVITLFVEGRALGCIGLWGDGKWYASSDLRGYDTATEAQAVVENALALHTVDPHGNELVIPADLRRLCAVCKKAPRWSAYKACKTCKVCGRPRKHINRRRNSYEHVPRAYDGKREGAGGGRRMAAGGSR